MMDKILLLPARYSLWGPITGFRISRSLTGYLLIAALGLYLSLVSSNVELSIFGLGLILPGGGFLAHANDYSWMGIMHFAFFISAVLIFLIACVIWFATGNVIAPPAVWLIFSVIAAMMQHGSMQSNTIPLILSILGYVSCILLIGFVGLSVYGVWKRKQINKYLETEGSIIVSLFSSHENTKNNDQELSPENVSRLRFLLDRSLQPLNEFNGFEWLDQFQTAAIRYQINFVGYALSMVQANYLSAFSGYMHKAQKNLILKQTDHRVWKYWAIENLWGNFVNNPDPVIRENIMYTGFCATQMAMYHAATNKNDFNELDSFLLEHPSGKKFSYNLPTLVQALDRDAKLSPFTLVACEPNWIYPLCNTICAAAINAEAPEVWNNSKDKFLKSLEQEFMDLVGRFVPCRSSYTGLSLPMIGGLMPQALPSFFLNATMPDVALRQWLIVRKSLLKDGKLVQRNIWPIDTGNYKFSRAAAYATIALAASEMGDDEVKELCFAVLDEKYPAITEGMHTYRSKASIWAHAVELLARSNKKDGFRNLMNPAKDRMPDSPYISEMPYPEVLPAYVTSTHTGLRAVLYSGDNSGTQKIILAGLIPNGTYKCVGLDQDKLFADQQGRADIHVVVNGRNEFEISLIQPNEGIK